MTAVFFYIYLAGMLLVACRLGWYAYSKLDLYDWRFHKDQIWLTLTLVPIFWPLLFFKFRLFYETALLFTDSYDLAARHRNLDRLRVNPPNCGEMICYRQLHARYEETFGEFHFPAAAVERVLRKRLHENPHLLRTSEEGAILQWVSGRANIPDVNTGVPSEWREFRFIADILIRAGEGTARCMECNEPVAAGSLIPRDEANPQGWSFNRLHCSRDHALLVVETMHISRAGK